MWKNPSRIACCLVAVSLCEALTSNSPVARTARTARMAAPAFSPRSVLSSASHTVLFSSSDDAVAATSPDYYEEDPWAESSWKFTLNLGRERGTKMPDGWGASGGRLVVPLDVTINPDRPGSRDVKQEDPMLQRNTFKLMTQAEPATYITSEGEQQAKFANIGEWKIRLPTGKPMGHAAKLMCYVDLETRIQKNDVVLKKGERIYLTAKAWREEELERAVKLMQPIAMDYRQKQERLEVAIEHTAGDRRLDGKDPVQTLLGMKDTAQLVLRRDAARSEFDEALRVYPSSLSWGDGTDPSEPITLSLDELPIEEGPWPGQVEWLSIEPLYAMVRRTKLFAAEEYHVIGTWSASPNLPDDYDDEEPSIF